MSSDGMETPARGSAGVLAATRALGIRAALFTQAVADRTGLASTDVECLEILVETGPLSAGEVASLTGLTSGAATRMLDRLEQAGFVRRTADPADRRRVIVEVVGARAEAVSAHVDALARAIEKEIGDATSDALAAIGGYLAMAVRVTEAETRRLREGVGPGEESVAGAGGTFVAPLAGAQAGRLIFTSGAPDVELRCDPSLGDLIRARFAGASPRIRARGGIVTVHFPRYSWLDWRAGIGDSRLELSAHWRKDRGSISLNGTIPWEVEVRGGASSLDADLRGLRLTSFVVAGGASRIVARLPEPVGVVPVRASGGMSDLTLARPTGVAVRLRVRGGASRVSLDGQRLSGVGSVALASAGADAAASRYEIEVHGGASRITVTEADR